MYRFDVFWVFLHFWSYVQGKIYIINLIWYFFWNLHKKLALVTNFQNYIWHTKRAVCVSENGKKLILQQRKNKNKKSISCSFKAMGDICLIYLIFLHKFDLVTPVKKIGRIWEGDPGTLSLGLIWIDPTLRFIIQISCPKDCLSRLFSWLYSQESMAHQVH